MPPDAGPSSSPPDAFAFGPGLDEEWFAREMTADGPRPWGVGEPTDYGFLTMLLQDETGGLEVRGPGGWIDVPPRRDAFICNLGDTLERSTRPVERREPERVPRDLRRLPAGQGREALP